MKHKLFLLLALLTLSGGGAWADATNFYHANGRVGTGTLTTGKTYMIYNTARCYFLSASGSGYAVTGNTVPLTFTTSSENYLWTLETGTTSGTYKIKNVGTSTYSAGGTALGSTATNYTIAEFSTCPTNDKGGMASYNDDGTTTTAASITSSNNTVYIVAYNTSAYWNGNDANFNTYEKAHVYVLYEVETIAISDDTCYKMDFMSHDGAKTWGLRAATTETTANASGDGDVFVAHSYTNTAGKKRWIFVNNSNGSYLAYHGQANSTFDLTNAINEWDISSVSGSLVTATNTYTGSLLCITNDKRSTSDTSNGCYILKESDGSYDNSAAPYYNNNYTSALRFTATGDAVSTAATLAIAKFDALYATKAVANITALYPAASVSTIVTNINKATTTSEVTTEANAFWTIPNGRKFYAVNSTATGQYMNIGTSQITATATALNDDAVMEVEYAGEGKYYLKGVKSGYYANNPSSGTGNPGTAASKENTPPYPLYIGNYANTTDNVVYFARAKAGGQEAIHYNSYYTDQGYVVAWDYSAGASQWNITYVPDENFTSYYTITDTNGATYTGSYNGYAGMAEPSFTGCAGYTLTDGSWSGTTYSATINFPFAVSSNSVSNPTFIGQFHNKSNYYSEDFLWHASDASVIVHDGDLPDATSAEQDKYKWKIIPSISGLEISFTVKNVSTGTYIYSTATSNDHTTGVSLSATATPVQYLTISATDHVTTPYVLYIPSKKTYLSVGSVNGDASQKLGVYTSTHDGLSVGFLTYSDLIARYWTKNGIATKLTMLDKCGYPAANNDYAAALVGVQTAMNSSRYAGNATNYGNLYTWYNGLLAADVILPTAGFYTFRSSASWTYSNLYLMGTNSTTQTTCAALYATDNENYSDKGTIWYYDGTYMHNYSNGYAAVKDDSSMLGVATAAGVAGTTIAFQKASQTEWGSLNLKFATNRYLYANNGYTDAADGSSGLGYNWNVTAVTTLPISMNEVSGDYFSTIKLPVAVVIPEGLFAYSATVDDDVLTLTKVVENGVLAANIPVILYSASDVTSLVVSDKTGVSPEDNALSGTIAAATVTANENYVLSKNSSDVVGFYKYSGTEMPGFKAYLHQEGSNIKAFSFSFEDIEDAIRAIESKDSGFDIYDIAGRRVQQARKGLYIINGKKVMVK